MSARVKRLQRFILMRTGIELLASLALGYAAYSFHSLKMSLSGLPSAIGSFAMSESIGSAIRPAGVHAGASAGHPGAITGDAVFNVAEQYTPTVAGLVAIVEGWVGDSPIIEGRVKRAKDFYSGGVIVFAQKPLVLVRTLEGKNMAAVHVSRKDELLALEKDDRK